MGSPSVGALRSLDLNSITFIPPFSLVSKAAAALFVVSATCSFLIGLEIFIPTLPFPSVIKLLSTVALEPLPS